MSQKRTDKSGSEIGGIGAGAEPPNGSPSEATASSRKKDGAFFTPRHVRIPHMREKVDLFYKHHPTIKKQYELAEALKVSEATLSNWINGTPSADGIRVNPCTVPTKHFGTLVQTFGIPGTILETEDIAEFNSMFVAVEAGRGAWDNLVRPLSDDESIEIIVNEDRRIVDPDADPDREGILRVFSDREIMFRIANPGFAHGALISRDRDGWYGLRPNSRWMETNIGDELVFPRPSQDGVPTFAPLEGSGVHLVLAIFTKEPMPPTVMSALMLELIDDNSLNQAAPVLNHLIVAGKAKLLSRRFLLVNAPKQKSQSRGTSKLN